MLSLRLDKSTTLTCSIQQRGIIKACFEINSYVYVTENIEFPVARLRKWALSALLDSPCQSRITQAGHVLYVPLRWGGWQRVVGRLVGAQCFRATFDFSMAWTPSHWHSVTDEPAELQWSRLMEHHGNSRHLARVHPTSSLTLSLSLSSVILLSLLLLPPDAGTYFPQTDWKPLWTNNGCTPV